MCGRERKDVNKKKDFNLAVQPDLEARLDSSLSLTRIIKCLVTPSKSIDNTATLSITASSLSISLAKNRSLTLHVDLEPAFFSHYSLTGDDIITLGIDLAVMYDCLLILSDSSKRAPSVRITYTLGGEVVLTITEGEILTVCKIKTFEVGAGEGIDKLFLESVVKGSIIIKVWLASMFNCTV
jgi:hypothetical protein